MAYSSFPLASYFTRVLSRFSHVQLFATLWTVACQAPLSIGCSRQEHWSAMPSSQRIFLTQGSNPCLFCLLHWQMDSLPLGRGSVYVSEPLSQFIPPSPSPAVCASLCSVPAFLFLPCNTGFMGTCDNLGHLRIHYVLNKWKLFPPFIPRLHGFENLFYSFRKIGDWAFLPVHNCKAHFGFRNNMRSRVPWH